MQEIKFRVWCKDNNGWEKDNCLFTENGELLHQIRHGAYMLLRPENHIASFYTGLKDKHGKEIYEGDVLEFDSYRGIINCTVSYDKASFRINPINDRIIFSNLDAYKMDYIKVIGNIYENPELLEATK